MEDEKIIPLPGQPALPFPPIDDDCAAPGEFQDDLLEFLPPPAGEPARSPARPKRQRLTRTAEPTAADLAAAEREGALAAARDLYVSDNPHWPRWSPLWRAWDKGWQKEFATPYLESWQELTDDTIAKHNARFKKTY